MTRPSLALSTLLLLLIALSATAQQTPPATPTTTRPAPTPATPPSKNLFHVYLLMGQSNMVGRDTTGLHQQTDHPRVLALTPDNQWIFAREPMHAGGTGVGPGIPFAHELLKSDPAITIGLVPCGVGGSSLSRWVKGAELYEKAVARARVAAGAGTLKGVLWHQGESDTTSERNAQNYQSRLTRMFTDLRADLDAPNLPIVVGQLGDFLAVEKYPYADTVRAALRTMPSALPAVAYADSRGLVDKGDKLHFAADAETTFGARFALAMQTLQRPAASPSATQPANTSAATRPAAAIIDVWPAGKMPGDGASEPEADLPPRGDNTRRTTNVSRPTLSLVPAAANGAPAAAMIVCPGGGYSYVVQDKEGAEVAGWLNDLGITALVLKYRTPNNRAGAFQDLQRALSLTRANADTWNIDPKRLGVIGFSAGGHLSARASTRFGERAYLAIDAVDGQSCRPDFAVLVYPAYLNDRANPEQVSPDLDLTADIPPTLIVHSEDDRTFIPGSKVYRASLQGANKPHDFLLYPTGGHGYGLRSDREARAWPQAAADWLRKQSVLRPGPAQNTTR